MAIVGPPSAPCVLGPVEVIRVLDLVLLGILMDLLEKIPLMDVDCNESLDFHPVQLVHLFETKLGELDHDVEDLLLLSLKLLSFSF